MSSVVMVLSKILPVVMAPLPRSAAVVGVVAVFRRAKRVSVGEE